MLFQRLLTFEHTSFFCLSVCLSVCLSESCQTTVRKNARAFNGGNWATIGRCNACCTLPRGCNVFCVPHKGQGGEGESARPDLTKTRADPCLNVPGLWWAFAPLCMVERLLSTNKPRVFAHLYQGCLPTYTIASWVFARYSKNKQNQRCLPTYINQGCLPTDLLERLLITVLSLEGIHNQKYQNQLFIFYKK